MEKQEQWIKELRVNTDDVVNTFGSLSLEKLQVKPKPDKWSIAENLDHLIKVNSSYFPIFQKLKAGTFRGPFISKIGFFPKLLGNLIYKSVADGGKKKTKTFMLWEPSPPEPIQNILEDFQNHQIDLIDWISQMKPFVESGTIIHSPINRLIVYSLEQAFDIMVAHEKRHLDQAKKVLIEIM